MQTLPRAIEDWNAQLDAVLLRGAQVADASSSDRGLKQTVRAQLQELRGVADASSSDRGLKQPLTGFSRSGERLQTLPRAIEDWNSSASKASRDTRRLQTLPRAIEDWNERCEVLLEPDGAVTDVSSSDRGLD